MAALTMKELLEPACTSGTRPSAGTRRCRSTSSGAQRHLHHRPAENTQEVPGGVRVRRDLARAGGTMLFIGTKTGPGDRVRGRRAAAGCST